MGEMLWAVSWWREGGGPELPGPGWAHRLPISVFTTRKLPTLLLRSVITQSLTPLPSPKVRGWG